MSGSDIYKDFWVLPFILRKVAAFKCHLMQPLLGHLLQNDFFSWNHFRKLYRTEMSHLPIIAASVTVCDFYGGSSWYSAGVGNRTDNFCFLQSLTACKRRPLLCTLHQWGSHNESTQIPSSGGVISWLHRCHRGCKRDIWMNTHLCFIRKGKVLLCKGWLQTRPWGL